MGEQWTCPYCNRPCTIDEADIRQIESRTYINDKYGYYSGSIQVIVCPNPECQKQTISAEIHSSTSYHEDGEQLFFWNLLPESEAKPYPDYIPEQLRNDYAEACLIKRKSPKASATLSRRCLQGMIRDFWGITRSRLVDEIDELQSRVDATCWDAIDSVRQVGNIGAHMEKDVNLIIDVDSEEAGLLIWLIETLFEEWYITR